MRYIDLSHTIFDQMPGYASDSNAQIIRQPVAPGGMFRNQTLIIGVHVGTHIDTPRHMLLDGPTVDQLSLQDTCGRAWLFDCRGADIINLTADQCAHIASGDKVLIWTGWGRHFGETAYFENYPVMSCWCCR